MALIDPRTAEIRHEGPIPSSRSEGDNPTTPCSNHLSDFTVGRSGHLLSRYQVSRAKIEYVALYNLVTLILFCAQYTGDWWSLPTRITLFQIFLCIDALEKTESLSSPMAITRVSLL